MQIGPFHLSSSVHRLAYSNRWMKEKAACLYAVCLKSDGTVPTKYFTISAQGFQCRTPDIPTEHQTFLLFLEFSVCPMSSVCREGRPQYFQRKIQSIQTRFLIRLYVYSTQILSVHLYWISPSLRFLLIYTIVKNPSIHAAIICNANKTIVRTGALVFLFTAWLIPVKNPQMAAAIPTPAT